MIISRLQLSKIISYIFIFIFITLSIVQSDKNFTLDEIDFPAVSLATSETGKPIYYRGEDNKNHIGLYHPPLYIYSLAAYIKIFGFNEISVRFFGVLCTLLTALISIKIIKKLFPREDSEGIISTIFISLFLSHPYTLANATLPDIDQTILPILISLYLLILIKLDSYRFNGKLLNNTILLLIPSLIFAVNLWAKLTTPLALVPLSFFIFLVQKKTVMNALKATLIVGFLGLFFFLVSYFLYCHFLNLPLLYTFEFLIHSFFKGTSGSVGLVDKIFFNIGYFNYFSSWLTIPFILLFSISFFYLILKKVKSDSEKFTIILSAFGIFVSLFYLCLISPFGGFFKYVFPVFFIFFIPIAYFIYCNLFANYSPNKIVSHKNIFIFIVLFVILSLSFQSIFVKDISFLTHEKISGLFLSIIFLISFIFSLLYLKLNTYSKILSCIIFALTLGYTLGISRTQAIASYPTRYEYGKLGFSDAVNYLKANVFANEPIWAMKDVGFYVNNIYYENYGDVFSTDLNNKFKFLINEKKVRFFVVTSGIGQDRIDVYPVLKEGLNNCCKLDKTFGNFLIYKVKDND